MDKEARFVNALPKEGRIEVTAEDCKQAQIDGVTLSAYLNKKYEDKAEYRQGLDAFDAALVTAGIVAKGDVKLGIESSMVSKFFTTTSSRLLFPEYVNRTIKETITDQPLLQYVVGETVTITGDSMRQPKIDLGKNSDNRKALKFSRVAEGAEIPTTEIKLAEEAVKIYKYGRAVKATYEVMRRTTIDMFRKTIELLGRFIVNGQYAVVIEVIENGDGNNNPATVYKRSVLNAGGTAGVLDEITLLKFLMVQYPINYDTVITDQDLYLQLLSTRYNGQLVTGVTEYVPFTFPQGIFKGITVLYSEEIAKSQGGNSRLFALNRNLGIRKIIEQNSSIQENEKYANDQTQKMFITENAGFAKIYDEASAILEVD